MKSPIQIPPSGLLPNELKELKSMKPIIKIDRKELRKIERKIFFREFLLGLVTGVIAVNIIVIYIIK